MVRKRVEIVEIVGVGGQSTQSDRYDRNAATSSNHATVKPCKIVTIVFPCQRGHHLVARTCNESAYNSYSTQGVTYMLYCRRR